MSTFPPSTDGGDGRDSRGRFTKGNPGGKGNPLASKGAALRAAPFRAVSPEDFEDIARSRLRDAKDGSIPAAKELFDRTLGKP